MGVDAMTGVDVFTPLDEMQHLLISGQSGGGKSALLNALMQGVFHNLQAFENVFLVDLKGGVEFAPYENISNKVMVFDQYEKLPDLVDYLMQKVEQRLAEMRGKVRTCQKPYILFVVDEFATINLQTFGDKAAAQRHKKLIADLNNLSMRGRAANIRIVASLQKVTADMMSASFKNNLQSRALFRVYDAITVAGMFGDAQDLPIKASALKAGQFIYEGSAGKRRLLQGALVEDGLPSRLRTVAAE